ncbi:hypothetical protein ABT346_20025 [Micromonospora peucetia]|uniref:hypothetical protein n=1 Tax=Micromonospora peucetia TaxID=47871 RepID=UPI003318D723
MGFGADPATRSPSEFVERLYRSSNSYADRLSAEELDWVDVDLGLNEHMLALASEGLQVLVTGNPGDGKTHVIERLRPDLEKIGTQVLTDANVLSDREILTHWRACHEAGRPMVLAINEWPLFVLRRHPLAQDFEPLGEALRQVQQAVYYGDQHPPAACQQVRVIDLSLRNVLAPSVVLAVIDRLCDPRFYRGLTAGDPAISNRDAMSTPRVRERLTALLHEVAKRGHHATMRQLVGFIAYVITGGRPMADRLAGRQLHVQHYAHLAFEGGVGPLFDAIRASFDPATVTHPRHDTELWRGSTDPAKWSGMATPGGVQSLPNDDRVDAYRFLKRRFYFEHLAGEDLLRMLPLDERRFDALASSGTDGGSNVVRDLLLALNRFYEPNCPDTERDQLVLWQSHRFDVRAPDTFLSLHAVPASRFRINPSRIAPWVEAWLRPEQRLTATFALAIVDGHGSATRLIVDRSLYLTLAEAHWGLGRASWSRSATRRVTRFVDQIHNSVDLADSDIVDVRIRNVVRDIEAKIEIQRQPARYRL